MPFLYFEGDKKVHRTFLGKIKFPFFDTFRRLKLWKNPEKRKKIRARIILEKYFGLISPSCNIHNILDFFKKWYRKRLYHNYLPVLDKTPKKGYHISRFQAKDIFYPIAKLKFEKHSSTCTNSQKKWFLSLIKYAKINSAHIFEKNTCKWKISWYNEFMVCEIFNNQMC